MDGRRCYCNRRVIYDRAVAKSFPRAAYQIDSKMAEHVVIVEDAQAI